MILDDEEGDQVCLACYLSALTVYTLPAILHLACHSHSCSKSLERVRRSSKSFQQVVLEGTKTTTRVHLHTMILYDEEGDQVCLACYLCALTVYTLPAIHTRVVSRWRE